LSTLRAQTKSFCLSIQNFTLGASHVITKYSSAGILDFESKACLVCSRKPLQTRRK